MKAKDSSHENVQMGHNNAFSIVLLHLVLIVCRFARRLRTDVRLQMLPNGLNSLQVSVAAGLDKAHVSHDGRHGHLADALVQVNFKLLQYSQQILLKSLHQQVG